MEVQSQDAISDAIHNIYILCGDEGKFRAGRVLDLAHQAVALFRDLEITKPVSFVYPTQHTYIS